MPEPLNDDVRRRMRGQGRRDTKPERGVRTSLHALGYRYRVDVKPEPDIRSRGDIVFTRRKVVVFIDGCFWHGCPVHAVAPKHNAQWWRDKLDANVARDRRNTEALRERGWVVLRFWEHETVDEVTAQIVTVLGGTPREGDRPR